MTNPESYDPEVISQVEAYLRREREDKEQMKIDPKLVREYSGKSVPRSLILARFIAQEVAIHGVTTRTIPYEQSVVASDELSSLAESTINLLFLPNLPIGKIDEGVELSRTPEGSTMLSMLVSGQAIPSFLSAKQIMFEYYKPQQLDDIPQIARALDINKRFPFGRLTIASPAGVLTDNQTKTVMDHVASQFPDSLDFAYLNDTDFYFFRNRGGKSLVGKVVTRPRILLGQRSLAQEKDSSTLDAEALSEITGGRNLALAKIGLLAVKKSVEYV